MYLQGTENQAITKSRSLIYLYGGGVSSSILMPSKIERCRRKKRSESVAADRSIFLSTLELIRMPKVQCFNEYNNSRILKNNYAEWIESMEWDFYMTLSTGYQMTLKSARRAADRFHKIAARNIGQNRLFWVAEPFDLKDGYHIHALVKFACERLKNQSTRHQGAKVSLDWIGVRRSWSIAAGNKSYKAKGADGVRADIQRYIPSYGANYYLGKYMQKEQADYDLLL